MFVTFYSTSCLQIQRDTPNYDSTATAFPRRKWRALQKEVNEMRTTRNLKGVFLSVISRSIDFVFFAGYRFKLISYDFFSKTLNYIHTCLLN